MHHVRAASRSRCGYPEPELATFCSPYVSCPGYLAEPLPEAEWPNERQARAAQAAVAQLEQATEAQARRAHEVLVVERQRIRNAIILEDDRTMGEAMDDWQREDLEMLDRYETRHALLSRPRGHSKTGDAGSEAVVELLTGKDKVMLAYAADQEQATLLLNDVKAKLRRGGYVSDVSPRTAISKDAPAVWQPGDPIQVHIYQDRIVSTSGNVLTVEASDVSSSWGKRPDWVVCDELVEWRRPELWQAIWSATGKRPRSRVIVITTSGWDKSHFAWDVFEMARTEDDWYFSSRRQCASWIQPKWLEQQRRTMPEHVYKRLHENLWVDGFGAFLSSEEVERIFTLEIPPANAGRSAIGLDVGLTHDRTVLAAVRLFPQPKAAPLLYCDTLETWQGSRSNKVDLADVQRSAYEASIRWKAPVYADPHQAEQLIQNLVKLGRHAKAYTFTSASRRDLFAGLFAAIREGRLRCAPHEELRRELLGLEVQTTASGSYRVDHKAGPVRRPRHRPESRRPRRARAGGLLQHDVGVLEVGGRADGAVLEHAEDRRPPDHDHQGDRADHHPLHARVRRERIERDRQCPSSGMSRGPAQACRRPRPAGAHAAEGGHRAAPGDEPPDRPHRALRRPSRPGRGRRGV